ncbi:hypothetical protein ACFL46_04150 [Candidatus Neomarinimicrobiota bacterium]
MSEIIPINNGKNSTQLVGHYENGKIAYSIEMHNGKAHGDLKSFDGHGRLEYQMEFKHGNVECYCIWYKKNGEIKDIEIMFSEFMQLINKNFNRLIA